MALGRLTRRSEFLAVAGARRKWAAPGLVLQAKPHHIAASAAGEEPPIRVGFTASKKVGNAVTRNRARRRLRAVAAEILPAQAAPGYDYVLIARDGTVSRPWPELRADLVQALRKVGARRPAAAAQRGEPAA